MVMVGREQENKENVSKGNLPGLWHSKIINKDQTDEKRKKAGVRRKRGSVQAVGKVTPQRNSST